VSINGLLNVSWKAITSNQIAMNVAGANIANVNTPGYTRQSVDVRAISSVDVAAGQAEYGVEVSGIKRLYNRYLEMQLMEQNQISGYDETRQEMMGKVEGIFEETGDSGLNELLNQFWNSGESLSTDPTNQVARYSVVSAAENLTSLFRENSNVLMDVEQDIRDSMVYAVKDINEITTELADLNQQILGSEANTGDANTLKDRTMELLKDLGRNVNISYYENDNGTVSVFLSAGLMLVGGNSTQELSIADGEITFTDKPSQVLNDLLTGGKIGAMIEMGETTVKGYRDSLDEMANALIAAVNTQHRAGLDGYGAAGGDFFVAAPGARNMQVSDAILQDTQKIAASGSGNNGENARLIGAIKDALTMNGGKTTLSDYYATLVGKVGYDSKAIQSSIERHEAITNQLIAKREDASGVSLDEEIMNLMKYQFGYSTAGRLVKVADELLDVLMALGE
jgi:flagellar hook-associated protein 1 FlgK